MNVIIPAAGLGTRLRPHTHHRPKPLVYVAGNTVMGHVLDKLRALAVDDLVFIVGHLGEQIKSYVERHYDFRAHFVIQRELLGQAHALALARDWLDGPVLIVFVDTLFEADLAALATIQSDGVVFAREVDDPRRFGVVTLDEHGYVTRFVEKPGEPISNLAVVGIYYLKDGAALRAAIDRLLASGRQTRGEYYLADALQLMVQAGARLESWPVSVWEDCGTAAALLRTNRYLLEQLAHQVPAAATTGSVIVPPVAVAADAVLEQSVVGPYVHVARGCRVSRSVVGPHVSLAEGVEVVDAIVRDAIVERGSRVVEANLGESLVGAEARVRGRLERVNIGDHADVG